MSPVIYPRLVEVTGRCPPEDCSVPWGYAELLDAIKDPELTEWIGADFDRDAVDPEWLTADVASLAKKWSRQPTEPAAPDLTAAFTGRLLSSWNQTSICVPGAGVLTICATCVGKFF